SNADATEWTIELRQGVTFTDGTPYNAQAVIFNWDRMQKPELASPCANTLKAFKYTAVDDLTIKVTLPTAQSAFPNVMMDCGSKVASPAAIQKFGDSYGTTAETTVGAGPFSLTEYGQGDHASYKRNRNFWDQPRPYLDTLKLQISPNNTATVDAILAGTVPAGGLSTFSADSAKAEDAKLQLLYGLSPGGVGEFFNLTREPT